MIGGQKKIPVLRSVESTADDWMESSRRLAREFIVFRDRVFPNWAIKNGKSEIIILVDRSVLSQLAIIPNRKGEMKEIYKNPQAVRGKMPNIEDVMPDLIFNLTAPPEVLLSRLDSHDPKYEFRKKNILEKTEMYNHLHENIPNDLKSKIILIDATETEDKVFEQIIKVITETK